MKLPPCRFLPVVVLTASLLSVLPAHAYYERVVDTTKSGFDADDGLTSLDEAVVSARWDDRIIFATGLSGTIEVATTMYLGEDIRIIGPASNPALITISGGGVRQIMRCTGWNQVRNLTFTGGLTDDSNNGGAIYADGLVTISNCIFINNRTDMTGATSERMGAAVFNDGGILTIENSTFEGNGFDSIDGMDAGGGAFAGHGSIHIDNCLFDQNTLMTVPGGGSSAARHGSAVFHYFPFGGATGRSRCTIEDTWFEDNTNTDGENFADPGNGTVANLGQELLVRNCRFSRNKTASGGGIYAVTARSGVETSDPTTWIYNSTLDANEASDRGGAVYSSADLTVEYTFFLANQTAGDGGAIWAGGSVDVKGCYFKTNEATQDGGAISLFHSSNLSLLNSLLILNRSGWRGGALISSGQGTIRHSTILRNTSTSSAVEGESINVPLLTMSHCMVAQNYHVSGTGIVAGFDVGGTIESADYNLVETLDPVTAEIFFTKKTHDLVGVSPHVFAYPSGSLMLVGDSRGINEGDPAITSVTGAPYDMYGNPRVAGGVIDIGAIEMRQEVLNMITWLSFYGLDDPFGDDDKDGIFNIVEAMLGTIPIDGKDGSPLKPKKPTPPPAALAGPKNGGGAGFEIEFPLDERITFLTGTLQTSPDLETWTDRATYVPLGGGLGIQRTGSSGVSLLESTRSGWVWKMREEIDPTGGPIFVRIDVREP